MKALATAALVGFCSHANANAQAPCPELNQLRSEAADAIEQMTGDPAGRCEAYSRFSAAWGAIAEYANNHRESCNISAISLVELEKRHREAETARDNICADRPRRSYPDIIRR